MTDLEPGISTETNQLSVDELEGYLQVAQRQADLYGNAWFTVRRVRSHAEFPKLPSLEKPGHLESTADCTAVAPDEIRETAGEFAVKVGYLAKAWEYRVTEIKALLRNAGRTR